MRLRFPNAFTQSKFQHKQKRLPFLLGDRFCLTLFIIPHACLRCLYTRSVACPSYAFRKPNALPFCNRMMTVFLTRITIANPILHCDKHGRKPNALPFRNRMMTVFLRTYHPQTRYSIPLYSYPNATSTSAPPCPWLAAHRYLGWVTKASGSPIGRIVLQMPCARVFR